MSITATEMSPTLPAFEIHDRFREVLSLGLSARDFEVLLFLAGQMATGNRVSISRPEIARAIGTSVETVRRSVDVLYSSRLLLEPDEGLPLINPIYLIHNPGERDHLVERFGVEAVTGKRSPRRRPAGVPHLSVVR